jgi:hypothetical protein
LRRRLLLRDHRGRRRHRALLRAAQHQDRRALADPVAHLDQQLLHRALARRGHVHRRLVALERDQRIVGVDRRALGHVDLDDRHVLEVPDVRDPDLHARSRHVQCRHRSLHSFWRHAARVRADVPRRGRSPPCRPFVLAWGRRLPRRP